MRLLLVTMTSALVAVALNLTAHSLAARIDIWPKASKVQPPRRMHYVPLLDEDLPF